MKKILTTTLLLFGLNTFALEPTEGIKIDGKEYKNIDSMTKTITENFKDYPQNSYGLLNEKISTFNKNVDAAFNSKNFETQKYINHLSTLSDNDKVSQLQAQIDQRNQAIEDAKKARDEKLATLSLKALYLVRMSNVSSQTSLTELKHTAESAITKEAVEKLNGMFIESLTIGAGAKFKEQITAKIAGSMKIDKVLMDQNMKNNKQFVYLAKVSVSPFQEKLTVAIGKNISKTSDIIVEYINSSAISNNKTIPQNAVESLNNAIIQYNQTVVDENDMTLQIQQQITSDFAKAYKKLNGEIETFKDEISEAKSKINEIYKKIGYTSSNPNVKDAKKYLVSKITALENEKTAIKSSELFMKSSRQSTESDSVSKDVAQMASGLADQLAGSHQKIDNFKSTSTLINGEVSNETKKQNQTLYRLLDSFWIYPALTDGNAFDVIVVAKFKISEAVGGAVDGAVATQNSQTAQPKQTYTSQVSPQESATLQKQNMGTYILPAMTLIKAGSFMMGGNADDNEKPIHKVTIPNDFYMGTYEVTFEQFDKYCEATGKSKPDDRGWGRGDRPAINVSWDDAVAYAKWLSGKSGQTYRLPSEEEWEYSARAGTTTKWSFGDDESDLKEYAWYAKNAYDDKSNYGTRTIGTKKPNPWGLYDMHGNVWEWTDNWYSKNYNSSPKQKDKVGRGGSWDYDADDTRSAIRGNGTPDYRYSYLGFRLLRTK